MLDLSTGAALENMFYINSEGKWPEWHGKRLNLCVIDGSITVYGLNHVLLIIFIPYKKQKNSEVPNCYCVFFEK